MTHAPTPSPPFSRVVLLPTAIALSLLALCSPSRASTAPAFPHRVTDGLADLRNHTVLAADDGASLRGRALLEAAAAKQGGVAWSRHTTLEVVGTDRWTEPSPWWPQKDQRVALRQLLGTFTSQAELLDGPAEGEVRGIQSWTRYRRPLGETSFGDPGEVDLAIAFYLPALHYFDEIVFRLLEAPTLIDAGAETLHGRSWRLVFATWGDPFPRDDVDHYVAWIAEDTGLVEKVHYTVRDIATMAIVPEDQRATMRAGATGTIHFADFREVGDVLFPFDHVVTLFGPREAAEPPSGAFVHRFEVERAAFDTMPAEALLPLVDLPPPGDRKP